MTFRKRLLTLTLVLAVPVAALVGILLLVSQDAQRTEADAALGTGLRAAAVTYADASSDARRVARRVARSPALRAAVQARDRREIRRLIAGNVNAGPAVWARVSARGLGAVWVGETGDPVGFTSVSSPAGEFTVRVAGASAAGFAARVEALTGLSVSLLDGGSFVAGRRVDPGAVPAASARASVVLEDGTVRARTVALDSSRDLRLVMYADSGLAGFALGTPALALLGVFLLAIVAMAVGLTTELLGQHSRLRLQAARDPLTGLWNRRHLRRALEREAARAERYKQHLSLLILDIDGFKQINDRHGHPAGDAVLEELAELIRGETRTMDEGARYGGDEMALVLPETGRAGSRILAERLRRRARERLGASAGVAVTISAGVATIPECADSVEDLVEAADASLLQAKREGRDRVCAAPIVNPARTRTVAPARDRGSELAANGGRGRYTRRRGE